MENKNTYLIGAAVFIVAMVLVFTLVMSHSNQSRPQINNILVTTVPYNNTNLTQTNLTAPTIPPASPANSTVASLFMTPSQTASILGSNGVYGVYQRTTPAQVQYVLPPAFMAFNVSSEYNMTYNSSVNGTNGNVLAEVIFPTVTPKPLYSYMVASYPYFNTTFLVSHGAVVLNDTINATIPGFTYSTSSFSVNSALLNQNPGQAPNGPVIFELLIGHRNSSVALVSIVKLNSTANVNPIMLAKLASMNLK